MHERNVDYMHGSLALLRVGPNLDECEFLDPGKSFFIGQLFFVFSTIFIEFLIGEFAEDPIFNNRCILSIFTTKKNASTSLGPISCADRIQEI